MTWSASSWRSKPAAQQPVYPDESALADCRRELARLPPLVTPWEVDALKAQLADAAQGKRFLLQGGDCAERFSDCEPELITGKLKILLQMSLVLVHGSKQPVIRVGRFAGQYAKPRSEDTETRDGVTLPSYRGDLINRSGFTKADRTPNPRLMLRGYARSALTLNFIRAMAQGRFADLRHPEHWEFALAGDSPLGQQYRAAASGVVDALHFMENVLGVRPGETERVDFFTSHEGLHLGYEEAQTRRMPGYQGWYDLSTHFPWVGMRTADPEGAHIEHFRGIANPIAVKIGPSMTAATLRQLIAILNPQNEPGRLTLIHRFGAKRVASCLPPLIEAVRTGGHIVVWSADPMHGNTMYTEDGIKTRHFSHILDELEQAFEIHAAQGSRLGGVHVELTGENVTECLGGARDLTGSDLKRDYRSEVDPRLNYEQALELALLIARRLR